MRVFRRVISSLLTLWLAATVTFFALRILPGDAIQSQLMQSGASPAVIEERRTQQGLNDPIPIQYSRYLLGLVKGDFGYSLTSGQPVVEIIGARLSSTLTLGFSAILIAVVWGLLLGTVTALDKNPRLSTIGDIFINLSLSMPIYWTGTLVILFFSAQLHLFSSIGAGELSQLLLPASVLGFHSGGAIGRVVRANIQDVILADFVRTARAKGLPESLIVRRHILRVGLLPTITVIAVQLGFLLSGTVITEILFIRPGIGRLLLEQTLQQDYPVVQGIVMLASFVYILLNTLADLVFQYIDPRVAVS